MIDLTDHFTVEGKKNAGIFRLLNDFLKLLETGNSVEETARFFELRLLMLSGYEPVLEKCIICNTPLDKINASFFDATRGRHTVFAVRRRRPELHTGVHRDSQDTPHGETNRNRPDTQAGIVSKRP